eukprot:265074-Pleurochrysis_carterae.AAC.1
MCLPQTKCILQRRIGRPPPRKRAKYGGVRVRANDADLNDSEKDREDQKGNTARVLAEASTQ